ncbi:MAG: hypothetical protein E7632_08825 [Ruminococcaceae bacterium]|nr:hypothetical protein [Oscillospiraceae bacterium]
MAVSSYDLREARQQADQLEDLSNNLKKQYQELKEIYDSIDASWEGNAATAFKQKLYKLMRMISNNVSDINTVAENIREVAYKLYREEQARQARARALSEGE